MVFLDAARAATLMPMVLIAKLIWAVIRSTPMAYATRGLRARYVAALALIVASPIDSELTAVLDSTGLQGSNSDSKRKSRHVATGKSQRIFRIFSSVVCRFTYDLNRRTADIGMRGWSGSISRGWM